MRFYFIALLRILPICDSGTAYVMIAGAMKNVHHLYKQIGRALRVPCLAQ